MEALIRKCFEEALEATGSNLNQELRPDTILLESGLDSLGFALLVALLEEELGFDPFAELEDALYPSSFQEFVSIYEAHSKKS